MVAFIGQTCTLVDVAWTHKHHKHLGYRFKVSFVFPRRHEGICN